MNAFVSIDPAKVKTLGAIAARLGSNHDGEILAAANMLGKEFAKNGLRIDEVVVRGLTPPQLPPPPVPPRRNRPAGIAEHVVRAGNCLMRAHLFSPKELKFLREIRDFRRPSHKQKDWLDALYERLYDGEDF
jgi:hypothetical protein